jgi:hypothetical protein
VDTLQAIGDFVAFYLSPYQSSKNIEFVQLKIHRKAQKIARKTSDDLLLKVACFTESLKQLKSYRKSSPYHKQLLLNSAEEKFYHELTHLNPEDCLILIANDRYRIDDAHLSLIIHKSEESVAFRRAQLKKHLAEESVPFVDPANLSPKDLIIQLTSTPQRINRSLYQSFQSLPFAVRFAIETVSVLFTLVLLMWIIPEIRNTYENSVQKRINDYLIESSLVDSPPPEGTTKAPKVLPTPNEADNEKEAESALAASAPSASKKQPKVNEGETWRFSFTGSMTNDIETEILTILKKAGLEEHKPLTIPGGIQFDFILPIQGLIPLKTSLEEMTSELQHKSPSNAQSMMSSANMSWYKRKMINGRKIPSGNVQVMIWISTL